MTLMNWDPWRDLAELRGAVNRLFEESLTRAPGERRGDLAGGNWLVPVDIIETPEEFVVRAELPGMRLEDIDITMVEDQLTIRGKRTEEKEEKGRNYLRVERRTGSFYRTLNLTAPIAGDRVRATYKAGVLEIHLPKAEDIKPKQIKVEVQD
ncbi:MAG: Hsp20/alpha crystallin family protein [Firmicutes bacterium]|jgi:HSP20 family protein|nr:Hsp20/alpha crystallin family protein [Bacillota bacterium]